MATVLWGGGGGRVILADIMLRGQTINTNLYIQTV
jgi:hypothetical protein